MSYADGFTYAGVIVGNRVTFSNLLAGRGSKRFMETKEWENPIG